MEKFKNRRELYYRGPKKGGIKKEDIFKMDHNFGVLLGASLGNRKTVERHYDLGGNLDAIDENGFPATVLASNSAQIEVVRLFLNKGADMSAKAPDGETALSVAVRKKKFNIARLLLKSIDDEEIISTVKVDTLNERKETPLFDAVRNNDTEMMELLLSYGASVDTVNKDGQIPLHVAAQDSRRQDALLMLLKNGSDINSQDARGWTPVFQAINSMNYGMVRILIKADANLKLENFEGETPLMRCVRRGRKDYLWALLGSGKVNIYSRNFLGETALDLARKFGRHDCEQILESAHKKLLTGDDLKFMTKYCEDWRSRHSACK